MWHTNHGWTETYIGAVRGYWGGLLEIVTGLGSFDQTHRRQIRSYRVSLCFADRKRENLFPLLRFTYARVFFFCLRTVHSDSWITAFSVSMLRFFNAFHFWLYRSHISGFIAFSLLWVLISLAGLPISAMLLLCLHEFAFGSKCPCLDVQFIQNCLFYAGHGGYINLAATDFSLGQMNPLFLQFNNFSCIQTWYWHFRYYKWNRSSNKIVTKTGRGRY